MNDAIVQLVLAAREASYVLRHRHGGYADAETERLHAAKQLDDILDQFCPACSSPERTPYLTGWPDARIWTCSDCQCRYGTCSEEASFGLVKSAWSKDPHAQATAIPFDLMTIDSSGNKHRRHGWMNPVTRLITQVG